MKSAGQPPVSTTFFEIFERYDPAKNDRENLGAFQKRMSELIAEAEKMGEAKDQVEDEIAIEDSRLKKVIAREFDRFLEELKKTTPVHNPEFFDRLKRLYKKLDDYHRKKRRDTLHIFDRNSFSTFNIKPLEFFGICKDCLEQQTSSFETDIKIKAIHECLRRCDIYKKKLEKMFNDYFKKVKNIDLKEKVDLSILIPFMKKLERGDINEEAMHEELGNHRSDEIFKSLGVSSYHDLIAKYSGLKNTLTTYANVDGLIERLKIVDKNPEDAYRDMCQFRRGFKKNNLLKEFHDFLDEENVSDHILQFVLDGVQGECKRLNLKYKLVEKEEEKGDQVGKRKKKETDSQRERRQNPKQWRVAHDRYYALLNFCKEIEDNKNITFTELSNGLKELYEQSLSTGKWFKFLTRKGPGFGYSIFGVTGKRRIHDMIKEIQRMHEQEQSPEAPSVTDTPPSASNSSSPSGSPRRGSASR